MPKTDFSKNEKEFSDKAHRRAIEIIYPVFYARYTLIGEVKQKDLDDISWGLLDGKMGIDRIIVYQGVMKVPSRASFQERFRRCDKRHHQDITITEYNPASDTQSELSKCLADYFLYGYYDDQADRLHDVVIVPAEKTIRMLQGGMLEYSTENNGRSKQPFIAVAFDELDKHELLTFDGRYKKRPDRWTSQQHAEFDKKFSTEQVQKDWDEL